MYPVAPVTRTCGPSPQSTAVLFTPATPDTEFEPPKAFAHTERGTISGGRRQGQGPCTCTELPTWAYPSIAATPRVRPTPLWAAIAERLEALGLEPHPDKTKIVYSEDASRRGSYEHISFDFLGYTFRGP